MLFRRQKKQGGAPFAPSDEGEPQLYRIEFDMMLKGSICKRRKSLIRQFGVTVNGSTRLVTSGDMVDRETYRALIAAGAIRPVGAEHGMPPKRLSSVDYTATERFEE